MAKFSKLIMSKNIKMDRSYTNVLDYTESQMLDLCVSNMVNQMENASYLNKSEILTNFSINECLSSNYIAFQNPEYSNKWFFAWIDDVVYINDATTKITFTIDAWSTWFDKWTAKTCFVAREHVDDDTVGLHTIPENLDIGQIFCDKTDVVNELGSESFFYFVIASNFDPSNETRYAGVGIYADYPQGCQWFAWLVNRENYADTINEISQWIYDITVDQHASDIQSMFALPYQAFNLTGDIDPSTHKVINGKGRKLNDNITYLKSNYRTFNDYEAKNGKVYTYPYSFARITNNLGSYNDYKIEDFRRN